VGLRACCSTHIKPQSGGSKASKMTVGKMKKVKMAIVVIGKNVYVNIVEKAMEAKKSGVLVVKPKWLYDTIEKMEFASLEEEDELIYTDGEFEALKESERKMGVNRSTNRRRCKKNARMNKMRMMRRLQLRC